MFQRAGPTFFYLDSLQSSPNKIVAKALCTKLKKLMQLPVATEFVELSVPRQDNMYDCGTFASLFLYDIWRLMTCY